MNEAPDSAPERAQGQGPEPARPEFGLPRTARVTTQADFRRIYRRGRRIHGRSIVAVGLANRTAGHRLGLSVSKEHGGAVRRNKIKRLLREAFRHERPAAPGHFDLILIPRPDLERRYDLEELRAELRSLIAALHEAPADRGDQNRRRGRSRSRGGRRS